MKKIDCLTKVIDVIVAFLMVIITVFTFVQVIRRYIFGTVFPWVDEIATYSMIWVTFLGAVLCLRHGDHTRIDAFINIFSHKIKKWIEVFDIVICFIFMMILAYHSVTLLKQSGHFLSTASKLPMYFVYSAIMVSGILMIPYFIILIIQKVREKDAPHMPSTLDDIDSKEGGIAV